LIEPEALKIASAFQHTPPQQLSFYEQDDTIIVHRGYFGLPFIDVTVNGTQQRFLLDTGASETILSSDIAEQCSAFPIDTSAIRGKSTTQDHLAAHPTIIDSISIGRLTVKNHTAIILDKEALSFKLLGIFPMFRIHGIIGWRLLKQIDLTLDYDRRTLTIRDPKNTKTTGSILLSLGKPYVLATTDTGIPLMFFWDSGAQSSSLTPTGVEKLHNARRDMTLSSRWGAGGSTLQVVPTIKDVTVLLSACALHFRNMKMIPNRDPLLTYDGILGNDIARKGVIRANAINGTLHYFLRSE
jgi:clan AA aspartic protease (TIGR02281 family)